MAEHSGFFNASQTGGSYDRVYDASDFSKYFSLFISDGVFINPADQLKVVAKSGRTVTVKAGWAFIEGYWYQLDDDMDITLSANTSAYGVIDLICCTLNKSNRQIKIEKKEQVSSSIPVNNGTIHELVLAQVMVNVGATEITNSNIIDRRPDTTYCGFVGSAVTQLDTSDLFLQFETAFNEWFDSIKGSLEDDPATSLQQQINELKMQVTQNQNALIPVEFLTLQNMSSVIQTGDLFGGTIKNIHGTKFGRVVVLYFQIDDVSRGGSDTRIFTIRDAKYRPIHFGVYDVFVGHAGCTAYAGVFENGDVSLAIGGGSNISYSNRTQVLGTLVYVTGQ